MELKRLSPEKWGRKLRRAREDAKLSLEGAEERLKPFLKVSYRTIARLEELEHCPEDAQRQLLAYLLLLACGYEPGEFGLGACKASELIDRERILKGFGAESDADGRFVRIGAADFARLQLTSQPPRLRAA